jgi:hypothetical protein
VRCTFLCVFVICLSLVLGGSQCAGHKTAVCFWLCYADVCLIPLSNCWRGAFCFCLLLLLKTKKKAASAWPLGFGFRQCLSTWKLHLGNDGHFPSGSGQTGTTCRVGILASFLLTGTLTWTGGFIKPVFLPCNLDRVPVNKSGFSPLQTTSKSLHLPRQSICFESICTAIPGHIHPKSAD